MSPASESTPETGPTAASAAPNPGGGPLAASPSKRPRELFRMLLAVLNSLWKKSRGIQTAIHPG